MVSDLGSEHPTALSGLVCNSAKYNKVVERHELHEIWKLGKQTRNACYSKWRTFSVLLADRVRHFGEHSCQVCLPN